VHALHHYERWWRAAEEALAGRVELVLHHGNYLKPPGSVTSGSGTPFKIYTPFMKAMLTAIDGFGLLPEPRLTTPDTWPASDALDSWGLLPTRPDWAGGISAFWEAGTAAALERFDGFPEHVGAYGEQRNLPATDGSSRMSPHLHWGEVSPRMLWERLAGDRSEGARIYRAELIWRDFAQNLIAQFPDYPERSYRAVLPEGAWRDPAGDGEAAADLAAWRQGRTGYPIVDAGMRQLWQLGWMHNRVRMITASFLIKHLLIDWRIGERWFWDTLVDADYGNNGTNWQWVAGTGVDASQFVRIMAPLSQSEKFAAADYIREWMPELAGLSDADIHDPPGDVRPAAYPEKRIGHREARERALAAYRSARG
jgi:deoxyribodipyrimidine photo-lyase